MIRRYIKNSSQELSLDEFREYLKGEQIEKITYKTTNQDKQPFTHRITAHYKNICIPMPHHGQVSLWTGRESMTITDVQTVLVRPCLSWDVVTLVCSFEGESAQYTMLFDYEIGEGA